MPQHFTIANFKFGLDSRRSELTSVPGTLLVAENGHINQGAQFEKRKAFVLLGQLPANCFGLQETPNTLITYGSIAAPDLSVFGGLITYSRIRHPYWQLDTVAPSIDPHLNPNRFIEPLMSGIVHSCTFGGKDFAIAAYTAEQDGGLDTFDDYFSGVFYYYDGQPVLNCLQGRTDFTDSTYSGGAASNYYLAKLFVYYSQQILGDTFSFSFGATGASDVSVAIQSPVNSPFSLVVSDTANGQLTTSTQTVSTAPVTGVGATTTLYLTQLLGGGGSKQITSFIAPNVIDGVINGTVDLLNAVVVPFNTSLYQTALDLVSKINSNGSTTGYTAQANYVGTTVASLTLTAPISFGDIVNNQNSTIVTIGIKTNSISIPKSGAVGSINYALAGGVTTKAGQGQVQKLIFNIPEYPRGDYQADLVFNGLTYTLGRGNLTTRRATTVFYLASGSGGSVDSITYKDGTNLLSAPVPFNASLLQTCKDVISNIVNKWNTTVGQYRYQTGAPPVLRNENTWLAYLTTATNTNGDAINGIAIVAPIGDVYNGVNNLTIDTTTLLIDTSAEGVGHNTLTLSLDGDIVNGSFLSALGGKLYMARGKQFNFSASFDCTKWERQDTGAGFVPTLDWYSSPTDTVAMSPYQGKMAVFSRRNISIWQVNADPAQYAQAQSLPNIGTFAKLSVQPLGDLDVLFLSDTGVRSLRVRDNTLNAFINDIGSPIDEFITSSLIANTATANAAACAIVEPGTGRYWLCLNGTIYVLSYYPSLKIVAWSTYLPTYNNAGVQTPFTPVKLLSFNGQVYVLDSNNNVYVYGGVNNNTYDGCVATAQSPWMDLKAPQMEKNSLRLNVAMTGKWQVQASMDPRANDLMTVVEANPAADGTEPNDSTFDEGSFVWSRTGTHFQFKATTSSTWAQAATFSSVTLQYNNGRDV